MKYSLGISNFLEEISSLSHSVVFFSFFALIAEEGFLISPCYSLELCIQMSIWMQSQKQQNGLCFQGKPFNITVIQVYALTGNAEEAEVEQFYEGLQDLLELTTKKTCPFHYRGLKCKSRKSRDT